MNRFFLLYSLVFWALIPRGVAQEKSVQPDLRYGKYFSVSTLLDYQSSKDQGVSPLAYRGLLFGGMGELGFEGKRWDIAIDGGVG